MASNFSVMFNLFTKAESVGWVIRTQQEMQHLHHVRLYDKVHNLIVWLHPEMQNNITEH